MKWGAGTGMGNDIPSRPVNISIFPQTSRVKTSTQVFPTRNHESRVCLQDADAFMLLLPCTLHHILQSLFSFFTSLAFGSDHIVGCTEEYWKAKGTEEEEDKEKEAEDLIWFMMHLFGFHISSKMKLAPM